MKINFQQTMCMQFHNRNFIKDTLLYCAFGVLLFSLAGCDKGRVFEENISFDGDAWSSTEIIDFEVVINDTLTPHNFYINLRNTTDYRYSNIYFFVETHFPDGKLARDTIECFLADRSGK